MADEIDLYGDIDDTLIFPSSGPNKNKEEDVGAEDDGGQTRRAASGGAPMSLVEENKFLREKVAKIQGENDVLKRNMGTLYRTATAEIQRKDKEILRLTTELDKSTIQKSERK